MLLKKIFILPILLILPAVVFGDTVQEDSQVWSETWIHAPEDYKDYDFGYVNYTRVKGSDLGVFDERQALFGTYVLSPKLNFTAQSIYIEQHPESYITMKQYRGVIDAHGKISLNLFRLTYRARAERQFRESSDDRWNFRPRLGFEIPVTEATYLFANTEGFYNSEGRIWFRLRNLTGAGFKVAEGINLDVYIGNQIERDASANDLNIAGFILRVRF